MQSGHGAGPSSHERSQSGPGSHILYQNIFVPMGGAILTCDLFYANRAQGFVNAGNLSYAGQVPNQHLRIDIMDPSSPIDDVGAGVLQNVFITNPGDPLIRPYAPVSVDLAPWEGQTVRVRFAEVDNQFFFQMGVDNCRAFVSVLQVPTVSAVGLAALALLLGAAALVLLLRRRAA